MTYADEMKGPVLKAAEGAAEVSRMLGGLEQPAENIGSALNLVKAHLDISMRQLIVAIKKEREAISDARAVLRGTSGMVADSINLLTRNEEELADNLKKLQRMRESVETMLGQIMPTYTEENKRAGSRARGASAHLRGYATTL